MTSDYYHKGFCSLAERTVTIKYRFLDNETAEKRGYFTEHCDCTYKECKFRYSRDCALFVDAVDIY